MNKKSHSNGFTLVELLVVVAVFAIIATIAAPNLRTLFLENRATTQVNQLVEALNVARSEAVRRNQAVTLCRVGETWADGWALAPRGSSGESDCAPGQLREGGNLLREWGALEGATLNLTSSSDLDRIRFDRAGMLEGNPLTFTYTIPGTNVEPREVGVSAVGRVTRE